MVANSQLVAAVATLFFSQSHAAAIPGFDGDLVPRGGGYPASNPPGVTCFNTWETVTNDVSTKIVRSRVGGHKTNNMPTRR